jgi:hypothetical protein
MQRFSPFITLLINTLGWGHPMVIFSRPLLRENLPLVTNELDEFDKQPVEVQDFQTLYIR